MSTVTRTVRIPLERPDDAAWKELRAVACEAARFGNRMLAGQYAQRMGWVEKPDAQKLSAQLFGDSNDVLSGWVRSAMERKCKAQWQRAGKDILAGRERLACFSADRALSIRATGLNDGVRFERDDESFVLALKLRPAREYEPLRVRVWLGGSARKDWFIREAVEHLWAGAWTPGIVTIRFDRMRRKIDALVSYSKPNVSETPKGERVAVLGPIDERGELWLRVTDGKSLDLTHHVARIKHMKEHFAGVQRRIRARNGRGPGRRQAYRHALEKAGSFSAWAEGPLHTLSRDVIEHCREQGVAHIDVLDMGDGDWPAHRFAFLIDYKARDVGMTVGKGEQPSEAGVRGKLSGVRKKARTVKRAKAGITAAKTLVG